MNIKVFNLRLTKENLQSDQDNLNAFLNGVAVKDITTQLLSGQPNFWSILVFYNDLKVENAKKSTEKVAVDSVVELATDEKEIFETLKQWRAAKAGELGIPSFMICHNAELMAVSKAKPATTDELIKIRGFGENKVAKYGNDILTVLGAI